MKINPTAEQPDGKDVEKELQAKIKGAAEQAAATIEKRLETEARIHPAFNLKKPPDFAVTTTQEGGTTTVTATGRTEPFRAGDGTVSVARLGTSGFSLATQPAKTILGAPKPTSKPTFAVESTDAAILRDAAEAAEQALSKG